MAMPPTGSQPGISRPRGIIIIIIIIIIMMMMMMIIIIIIILICYKLGSVEPVQQKIGSPSP